MATDWRTISGFIMLLGGAWVLTAPFVIIFAARRKRWVIAGIYALPVLWFVVGYVITLL